MTVPRRPRSSPGTGRPHRLALLAATALVGLSVAGVGGTGATAAPLAFALSPVLEAATGNPVCDPLDESPDYADIACNTSDHASAYFGSNGTVLGAGFVLEQTPVTASNQAPFESTTYVVMLGVGGVHTASIGIDGKRTNDQDYLYAGCANAAAPTYTKALSTALADGTVTVAADGAFTRVTFNVPLSALVTCGITAATPLTPYFGTSQAGPLDNINKDFFLGRSVSFNAVNQAPIAVDDSASTPAGTPKTVNVLVNDSDPDGDQLTVTSATNGAHGTTAIVGNQVVYTPAAGYVGTDTFTYTISDGKGGTDTATVTMTMTAVNRAPDAVNDSATTGVGVPKLVNVLANDWDPDGDPLTVTAASVPGHGTAVIGAGGILYTPVAGYVETDTFTYTISDGKGGTDNATVTITIAASPPPPPPAPVLTPDLSIDKAGPTAAVTPGSTVSYTLTVSNIGTGSASNVQVTDTLPTGLTLVSASGTGFTCTGTTQLTCSLAGTLAPAAKAVVNLVATLSGSYAATSVANTAVVLPTDTNPANNSDTETTSVTLPQDLGMSKTGLTDTVQPGDVLSWTLTVTNVKGTPASSFTVTDEIPFGLTLLSVGGDDWSCTSSAGVVTCAYTGAPLPVGAGSSFQLDALVGADYVGDTVANTAVVDPGGVDPTNDSATDTTAVVQPSSGGGGGEAVIPTPSPTPSGGGGKALPFTGSSVDLALTAGVAGLLAGLVLVLVARRRHTTR